MAEQNIGRVVQVIGPVLDVEFDPENLPDIYNALHLKATTESGQDIELTAEVQQHIGRGQVRAVAMTSKNRPVPAAQRSFISNLATAPSGLKESTLVS